ncbi:hypothetical protein EST38_g2665 [Candolleomyces aberdarensis]|uniref:CHAT domain-containing protein n=1 Tax=Candolleomyces aberdarensis TaxID=2316362 RepID=A0A4Q2DSY4_9AGAR|nr:hypothetical protein EST38_g2665 [Candolleomyces aberdarensis]
MFLRQIFNWKTNVRAQREISITKLFISRYKHTGQIVDLDDTISAVKRAVALFTEDEDGDPVDIAVQLINLGKFYKLRFERTNRLEDLNESISNQQTSVGITPDECPRLPYWMDNLATSLAERFDLTKNISDIDDAIRTFRTALEERGLPQGHPHIPHLLYNLSIALLRRSEAGSGSSSLADLDNAISNRCQALSLLRLQQGHTTEELSTWINTTATLIVQRFERTNSLVDLEESIRLQQESIDLMPGNHHRRIPLMLSNLAASFYHKFQLTGKTKCLEEAIEAEQKALSLSYRQDQTPPQMHYSRRLGYERLALWHFRLSERTGRLADIDEALSFQKKLLEMTPPTEYGARFELLGNLGLLLHTRFLRSGKIEDINEAIRTLQAAKAVYQHRPLGVEPSNGPIGLYNNLGNSLARRFERTGNLVDLDEAVSNQKSAVNLVPDSNQTLKSSSHNNLGISLTLRFERTGTISDIEDAITSLRNAVALSVPLPETDEPVRKPNDILVTVARINNLSIALLRRFERGSALEDIQEAILYQQKVVQFTPHGHPDLPARLNNLGKFLHARFSRMDDASDLATAISCQLKAVELLPNDHPDLPAWLNNLGGSFLTRMNKTSGSSVSDIDRATTAFQRAIQLTPADHASRPMLFHNLGNAFSMHFKAMDDLHYAEEAISTLEMAVSLTPDDDAHLPSYIKSMADVRLRRFCKSHDGMDLENAITALKRAVDLTPPNHAFRPSILQSLGDALLTQFHALKEVNGTQAHTFLEESITCYREGAMCPIGPPSALLSNAVRWANTSFAFKESEHSLEAFERVVELMPAVAGLEQTAQERHRVLSQFPGIASSAAAAAFACGMVEKALKWLEQGRCLVWSQYAALRTPLEDLRAHDPSLADRLAFLSKSLENFSHRMTYRAEDITVAAAPRQTISLQDEIHQHVKVSREYNEAVEEARRIPGFETFLSLPFASSSLAELSQHLPEEGPVVLINVNQHRCDALVLMAGCQESEDLIHVPLTFSLEMAELLHGKLRDELTALASRDGLQELEGSLFDATETERAVAPLSRRTQKQNTIRHILGELWEHVVKPILDAVAITVSLRYSLMDAELILRSQPSGSPTTRIWWCPTGPLAFLPIHAAGKYMGGRDTDKTTSIFDYAISSYTPTVSALTNAIKRRKLVAEPDTTMRTQATPALLLVNQSNAPGLTPIPGTTEEIRAISRLSMRAGLETFSLDGAQATIDSVIAKINDFNSIHLACHACQSPVEPLRSGFSLYDGRLDLSKLIQTRHSRTHDGASIAFLSACQTSTGDVRLSDEAVHLAAGMMAAGYTEVVGTMWSIQDRYAPKVAENFYKCLFAGSEGGRYGGHGAHSLFQSLDQLRRTLNPNSPTSYLAWVPYVHFGI